MYSSIIFKSFICNCHFLLLEEYKLYQSIFLLFTVIFHVCIELHNVNIEIIITGFPREGSVDDLDPLLSTKWKIPPPLLENEK